MPFSHAFYVPGVDNDCVKGDHYDCLDPIGEGVCVDKNPVHMSAYATQ